MKSNNTYILIGTLSFVLFLIGCGIPMVERRAENTTVPQVYTAQTDTTNVASINWRVYFADSNLVALIDTALRNNQELNIITQEIAIARNEISAKEGEYMPSGKLGLEGGPDKAGKYTWNGFSEEDLSANPDKGPKYVGDFSLRAMFSWELDVWNKLRNAKDASVKRFLESVEGRNFMVTRLVSEIASSYYELESLDNQLEILKKNIEVQQNALNVVRQQKEAAKVTELAVNRFEAQLLNTQNLQFEVQQQIVEIENRINYLTGRFSSPIPRNDASFFDLKTDSIATGVPSQLLLNRPDIRQAELEIQASDLDVQSARANFLPSFSITANVGFQSFNPLYLVNPSSVLYNVFGEIAAPLINRRAIEAAYYNANAKQIQAAYKYEQTILNGYVEVLNQISRNKNYTQSLEMKSKQVDILNRAVVISNSLFQSARADYAEVLLTQREALDARMELIEVKLKQVNAKIGLYAALGGGWR